MHTVLVTETGAEILTETGRNHTPVDDSPGANGPDPNDRPRH